MLLVLMFNIGGYMLLFQYFIKHSDDYANEQINKGLYKPDELVEIKIPVHLPNIQNQADFQGISGQVKLNDADYNYVALKITRDTMFLMCIPNYEKTRLISENIIVAKNISDIPLAKKNHIPVQKKSGTDSFYDYAFMLLVPPAYRNSVQKANYDLSLIFSSTYISTPAQPPEAQGISA